jgi:hypothetical protein
VITPSVAVHAAQRAHLAQHALAERDWMTRPSCSVMEQKVHPPKQPRMVTMECFTVSKAGIFSVYDQCGAR